MFKPEPAVEIAEGLEDSLNAEEQRVVVEVPPEVEAIQQAVEVEQRWVVRVAESSIH